MRDRTHGVNRKAGSLTRLFVWCCVLVAATLGTVNAAERPADARLAALFEREYQAQLRDFPEDATYDGVNDYNDRLADLSFAAIARRKAHAKELVDELQRFDVKRLNVQDAISREMMLDDLRQRQAVNDLYGPLPFDGLGDWLRVRPTNGPQQSLVSLTKATPFATVRDYENYLKRLAAFPRRLDQTVALLREGMRSGWLPPRVILMNAPGQFDAFLGDDVTKNPLYRPFAEFGADVPVAERERLATAGRAMLTDRVNPALAAFRRFLVDDYLPACKQSLAASDLPGGASYYALAVKASTTTTLTPRQVHDIGLAEVDRIGKEMDALTAGLGFTGTRAAFFDRIRKDPQFYYTDGDDMLRDYRDIAKRVDAELPKLFATLPRLPYGIRAMEAYEGDAAEHYSPGALDGSRAGWFEANVHSLATRPKYDMENTFVHEAVPGHHLQIARAQELQGLPRFRRNGFYVAYDEGWALYAESLGPVLGLYRDPYSALGARSWEMVRACRLVIDTGLHAFGWTREQSIRYMMDNAGLQEGFATAEVDRYIANPAQALGYKIGELKIKQLRDRAKVALGDRFDIRTFHNAILDDGAVPMTILESRIDQWIAARKATMR